MGNASIQGKNKNVRINFRNRPRFKIVQKFVGIFENPHMGNVNTTTRVK